MSIPFAARSRLPLLSVFASKASPNPPRLLAGTRILRGGGRPPKPEGMKVGPNETAKAKEHKQKMTHQGTPCRQRKRKPLLSKTLMKIRKRLCGDTTSISASSASDHTLAGLQPAGLWEKGAWGAGELVALVLRKGMGVWKMDVMSSCAVHAVPRQVAWRQPCVHGMASSTSNSSAAFAAALPPFSALDTPISVKDVTRR